MPIERVERIYPIPQSKFEKEATTKGSEAGGQQTKGNKGQGKSFSDNLKEEMDKQQNK